MFPYQVSEKADIPDTELEVSVTQLLLLLFTTIIVVFVLVFA